MKTATIKTAAYTICKNEINRIDRWFEYAKIFDYRVILDTGSDDGTWEKLQNYRDTIPNTIIEQKRIEPFKFHEHRNYNLNMIPEDVDWCLSPDMDEWFSINVLEEIELTCKKYPNVTNIATTRLDIYSKTVFVGPDKFIPSNKIHRRIGYEWRQPIYEHLWYIGEGQEVEIYNDEIFLIHDQETNKPRSKLYSNLMKERFEEDKSDNWNNWYLMYYYRKKEDLENYLTVCYFYLKNIVIMEDKEKLILDHMKHLIKNNLLPENFALKPSLINTVHNISSIIQRNQTNL